MSVLCTGTRWAPLDPASLKGGAMSRVIKLRVNGRGAGTDAPTVEDVLDQIRDYVDILRGVERPSPVLRPARLIGAS